MPNNHITIPLGLQEDFSVLDTIHLDQEILIRIQKLTRYEICPNCNHPTNRIHQITPRKIQDLPLQNKKVTLIVLKRRFFCPYCHKPFTENFISIAKRSRRTKRFEATIYQQGKITSISLKDLSRISGIKYTTLRRLWYRMANQELNKKNPTYPRTMGIDEFSVAKGHHYDTVLTDLDRHCLFDTIAGRDRKGLKERLERIPEADRPNCFVIDLWQPFIRAIAEVCPKADIVVDKFHVIRLANAAVDKTRKMVQWRKKHGKKWWVYAARHLLLTAKENLTGEERLHLDRVLSADWRLGEAYDLKEVLRDIYNRTWDYETGYGSMKSWCELALSSGLPAFVGLGRTILRWLGPITNYFKYWVTNGYTEGINNRIKLDKRLAYGYRNFTNQRVRILSRCG